MASNRILPAASAALSDKRGLTTPQFYRFFQSLAQLDINSASQADIAALQAEIEELAAEIAGIDTSPQYPVLQPIAPIFMNGLLQNGFAQIGIAATSGSSIPGSWVFG